MYDFLKSEDLNAERLLFCESIAYVDKKAWFVWWVFLRHESLCHW